MADDHVHETKEQVFVNHIQGNQLAHAESTFHLYSTLFILKQIVIRIFQRVLLQLGGNVRHLG